MTNTMDLLEVVKGYLNSTVNHNEAPHPLLDSIEISLLYELIAELLQTTPGEIVDKTCLFIIDAYFLHNEFADKLLDSPIIPALEALMLFDDCNNRYNAVYTLGKIGSHRSTKIMAEATNHFLERDPFFLRGGFFELRWLGDRQGALDLIEKATRSHRYLTRWSVIEVLSGAGDFTERVNLFSQLQNDPHEAVRSECHHAYQRLMLSEARDGDQKLRRKMQKDLNKHPPTNTFFRLEQGFFLHLHELNQRTYEYTQLEDFAVNRDTQLAVAGRLNALNGRA